MEFKGEKIRHVFPARAGMSRLAPGNSGVYHRVPRASGDEPVGKLRHNRDRRCSPRERG